MQVDTVMSLASMIAAAVTAVAAVRGEWSWTGRARECLELARLFDEAGGERSASVARMLRARALVTAERETGGSHRGLDAAIAALLSLQAILMVISVMYGMDVMVPAACLLVSSVLAWERS